LDHEFSDRAEAVAFLEASRHEHLLSVGEKRTTKAASKPLNTSRLLQCPATRSVFPETRCPSPNAVSGGADYVYANREPEVLGVLCAPLNVHRGSVQSERYVGDLNKLVNKNSLTPHGAIRVSNISMNTITHTDSRVCSLYKLIWKNTIESCMSDAIYNSYTVAISGAMNHRFYTRLIYRCLRVGKSPT
jgi:DNA topoisomerase IA